MVDTRQEYLTWIDSLLWVIPQSFQFTAHISQSSGQLLHSWVINVIVTQVQLSKWCGTAQDWSQFLTAFLGESASIQPKRTNNIIIIDVITFSRTWYFGIFWLYLIDHKAQAWPLSFGFIRHATRNTTHFQNMIRNFLAALTLNLFMIAL